MTEASVPIRIHLSPPDVGDDERAMLLDAFDSNWIAPVGPHINAFESELAAAIGAEHAVAVSSGTAALHLALVLAGIGPGDRVLCPTMTFVASANAIRYVGAEPVFVDVDADSWNIDAKAVAEELAAGARHGNRPAALLAVDLYGRCCDYEQLLPTCDEHGVVLIEDAAEALGASHRGRSAGTFGRFGAFSFNGNKIITTSGGGMLVTQDAVTAERARSLASQARDPAPHYQHSSMGYNYRMSNLLAALGRAQLRSLDDKVAHRRRLKARYRDAFRDLPGVEVAGDGADGLPNAWLTCVTIEPELAGTDREKVRMRLGAHGIEARPVWKPMHLQPLFAECRVLGGRVAEGIFARGLCLPSGSSLTDAQQDEVCEIMRSMVHGG